MSNKNYQSAVKILQKRLPKIVKKKKIYNLTKYVFSVLLSIYYLLMNDEGGILPETT